MKKVLALIFLFALTSTSAMAGWVRVDADVQVNQRRATAVVYNSSSHKIFCKGYVYGRTQFGEQMKVWATGWIRPYENMYGYVNAYGNRYLVAGWADIRCKF